MLEVLASLYRLSEERPDAPAFSEDQRTLSYAELAAYVGGLSQDLDALDTGSVGILAANSLEWVVADLSLAFAGKTMVPLPVFFSPEQLRHIIADANVTHVLVTAQSHPLAEALGLEIIEVTLGDDAPRAPMQARRDRSRDAQRIIYTSGTTGAPKGVRLGAAQISASTRGLMEASEATSDDRYLSVLPFSLLLEQIAGICVPLLAGAQVTLAPHAAGAALKGDAMPLLQAFFSSNATTCVLVPGLLAAYTKILVATANAAPSALRFVAVGGAPVNPALAEQAWALGIPVHEGYGLSECCSVVSVNRPGARVAGSTGPSIPGVYVTLEDGEIVVHSKTVMDGYLNTDHDAPDGVWRTGDLGEITERGALKILGRKDNLIVTQAGRNISPEWVEGVCENVNGVAKAILAHVEGHGLVLICDADKIEFLRDRLSTLPNYARPEHIATLKIDEMIGRGLLTPLGDVRRAACTDFAADWVRQQHAA